jgi:hypothetical protein
MLITTASSLSTLLWEEFLFNLSASTANGSFISKLVVFASGATSNLTRISNPCCVLDMHLFM